MDKTSTSESEMTPEQSIREYLRKNPIKMSPFGIENFFADSANVSEEYLDSSIDDLAEFDSNFEETHKELFEELQKWALLTVPLVRKIPLFKLLGVIQECAASTHVFPYFPDFPKAPALKILDHIFPDNSLSFEEKILEYEQIAKNTHRLLSYLRSWRDNVADYVEGLEKFRNDNINHLSKDQKERINQLMEKSRKTIPQIDLKIEQKKLQESDGSAEVQEFEQFFKVVSKEQKYSGLDPRVARSQIQRIYDESDHDLRRIVARMGIQNGEEVKTRKRSADSSGFHVSRGHSPTKKSKMALIEKGSTRQKDEKVSVLSAKY